MSVRRSRPKWGKATEAAPIRADSATARPAVSHRGSPVSLGFQYANPTSSCQQRCETAHAVRKRARKTTSTRADRTLFVHYIARPLPARVLMRFAALVVGSVLAGLFAVEIA